MNPLNRGGIKLLTSRMFLCQGRWKPFGSVYSPGTYLMVLSIVWKIFWKGLPNLRPRALLDKKYNCLMKQASELPLPTDSMARDWEFST